MGYAIAQEAAKMGANVVLISGEARLEVPGCKNSFQFVRRRICFGSGKRNLKTPIF